MIKINNLTKKYKDKVAVDNLNLEIKTGELEYKDVFTIHINGSEYCLCMDHFFQLLDNSDYAIVNKDSLTDDDVITIPKNLAKDGTEEEVKQYIEKAIKNIDLSGHIFSNATNVSSMFSDCTNLH